MKIHRWQPTGFTPCGRSVGKVKTNKGKNQSDGVDCRTCNNASTLVSLIWITL